MFRKAYTLALQLCPLSFAVLSAGKSSRCDGGRRAKGCTWRDRMQPEQGGEELRGRPTFPDRKANPWPPIATCPCADCESGRPPRTTAKQYGSDLMGGQYVMELHRQHVERLSAKDVAQRPRCTAEARSPAEAFWFLAQDLRKLVDDEELPGFALVVAQDGVETFECYGNADVERQVPFRCDAHVRWYSMTKAVTAFAVWRLIHDGVLDLGDEVAKYLPEFAATDTPGSPMRIRHLLAQTGGLPYGGGPEVAAYAALERRANERVYADIRAWAADVGAINRPAAGAGRQYGYSFDVLGAIIEVAYGAPLPLALRLLVFAPLGMEETGFAVPPDSAERIPVLYAGCVGARGEIVDYGTTLSGFVAGQESPLHGGGGGVETIRGGLVGPPADYLKFCEALRCEGGGLLSGVAGRACFRDLAAEEGGTNGFCSVGKIRVTKEHFQSVVQKVLAEENVCSEVGFPELRGWERKAVYDAAICVGLEYKRAYGRADGTRVKFARDGPKRTVSYEELAARWEEPVDRWLEQVHWGGMGGTMFVVSPVYRFSLVLAAQVRGKKFGRLIESRLAEVRRFGKEEI